MNNRFRRKRQPAISKQEARDFIASLQLPTRFTPDQTISPRSYEQAQEFYRSKEWQDCRSTFLSDRALICVACDIDLSDLSKLLNVDHIMPLRYYWERRVDQTNLQVLCCDCNKTKGNQIVEDIRVVGASVLEQRSNVEKVKLREAIMDEYINEWREEWAALPGSHRHAAMTFDKYVNMRIKTRR